MFIKAKFFCTTRPSLKLTKKFLGPFEIIAQVERQSFTLCLSDSICAVHSVFHISMLELHISLNISRCVETPPSSVEIKKKTKVQAIKYFRL